ncbi:hypothetical protein ACJ2_43340 [Pantoea sp. QMID2]|nr:MULTISPECIES: hypothetical protein [unclassified Pantoea]GME47173.1 hypothetical protein ACJ1_41870 [Pantoea sp. QMID1]GME47512.1 hypothetical protein ACJ3_43350 [Pantoea sp. QMID3]GME62424.1 hypothetical protein ACJ4_43230 [Pantoea sp. QMID4]GME63694.1 hypothetical protein ACJ2_43340 [Pantoea sp. QMID2]
MSCRSVAAVLILREAYDNFQRAAQDIKPDNVRGAFYLGYECQYHIPAQYPSAPGLQTLQHGADNG